MEYDSRRETLEHIENVQMLLHTFRCVLHRRLLDHDHTKLQPFERQWLDKMTPRLRATSYGSDEYRAMLAEMKPMLEHHYAHNRHHPEHFKGGVNDMTLVDLVEMLCDWMAATLRHADGDIAKSFSINAQRFGIDAQLIGIFKNTIEAFGWDGRSVVLVNDNT